MNYYPKTLPKFLQSGYSLKRTPSVIRTTMTNGTVRQRLLSKDAPHVLTATLQFNNLSDYQTWVDFYNDIINYGVDWFIAPILNDSFFKSLRFLNPSFNFFNSSFNNFSSSNIILLN